MVLKSYWGFSEKHMETINATVHKYYNELNSYKKDRLICRFFKDINLKMADLNLFLNHIPVFTSFVNEEKLYYLLFDKEALYLLHSYCYYSILYELVTGSDTDDYLRQDIQTIQSSAASEDLEEVDFG